MSDASVIAAVSILGVGLLAAVLPRESGASAGLDMMSTGSVPIVDRNFDRYELRSAGEPTGCTIDRARAGTGAVDTAKASPECAALLPALAGAHIWQDGPDGSMALADENGVAIVAFAAGDGVDYESYWPAVPLLSLALSR